MAQLRPAPFKDLIMRLHLEPRAQDSLFDLPRRSWYVPAADAPDMTCDFHGLRAGNPLGPAAGPHTQMAQNLLLSYVAGARILELKTVQIDDRLNIPRPCIDATNVCYNVEWSQELLVAESLREYTAGSMLVHAFRHGPWLPEADLAGPAGEVLYDISIGYDLAGVTSDKVRRFLDKMRHAGEVIERLRSEIPPQYAARDLDYPTCLSRSVTLSTFHGCPADEIERICEFVIEAHDFDVVVKMNPPMLGKAHLEHILFDVLGFNEVTVNPKVYQSSLDASEAVEMCRRLTDFAAVRRRRVGFKFTNTLEVINHRDFFTADNRIMYLSGQPLYVLAMTLADEFRRAVGPHVPITFSGGVDRFNVPTTVACGYVPVTISADLLRTGGYGRLPPCLHNLAAEMRRVGASTIDEYVLNAFGRADEARGRAEADPHCAGDREAGRARWAGWLNTTVAASIARSDARYTAQRNRKVPRRIDSRLEVFDCITCDKCIPVCPNAANFTYPTPRTSFPYHDLVVDCSGGARPGEESQFEITEGLQIACYADFCNECGNCDTFCPEYGGPYIKKPSFFGTVESWAAAAPRDGFVVGQGPGGGWIRGRIRGAEYELSFESAANMYRFSDGVVEVFFSASDHVPVNVRRIAGNDKDHNVPVGVYHMLRHLREGVLDPTRVNQVNVALLRS